MVPLQPVAFEDTTDGICTITQMYNRTITRCTITQLHIAQCASALKAELVLRWEAIYTLGAGSQGAVGATFTLAHPLLACDNLQDGDKYYCFKNRLFGWFEIKMVRRFSSCLI